MAFLKRHWLFASAGLVVFLCVVMAAFLVWRATQPVESKTVYVLPEPNPERAEILKRALQPQKRAYTPQVSSDEATTEGTTVDNLDDSSGDLSVEESKFMDDDIESMLAVLGEETAEEKGDFPPIPEGFLENNAPPVWTSVPGYQKGDMPEHEKLYRVLIKLWNQGEHGFHGGSYDSKLGKVYPLYPDVVYVTWYEATQYDVDGNPIGTYKSIGSGLGMQHYQFTPVDFMTGNWKTKYPGLKILDKNTSGYNPEVFLTDSD